MAADLLRRARLPALFFLATLLVRWPVLSALRGTLYPFEVFSGSVAAALLDGLDLDVQRLYIIQHVRGGSLFGVLLAPLYALFGSHAWVMKLVPLLWHASTVALAVAVLRRFFGRQAGVAIGLLLVFAPPLLSKLSVMGFASHMESSLPTLAALGVFCSMTLGPGTSRKGFLLFGLVLGFSAFFHLQALLACLMLLGLLFVHAPKAVLRGTPWLLLGAVLTAWPMLLFESDDRTITKAVMSPDSPVPEHAVDRSAPDDLPGALSYNGWRHKTRALLTGGLGPVLEFGHLGTRAAKPVAHTYGLALLLACALALWQERRKLWGLCQRVLLWRDTEPSALAFLPLHALALLLLLVVSVIPVNVWTTGSGMEGRRLTPVLFSLLLLAAIGIGRARERPRAWLANLLLLVMCASGAAATLAIARAPEAARLPMRGECYEWFLRQLEHHAHNDPIVLIETLERIDRGDPRFATLRFPINMPYPEQLPLARHLASTRRPDEPRAMRLHRLAALGRVIGSNRKRLEDLALAPELATLDKLDRATLFHGAGSSAGLLMRRTDRYHPLLDELARMFRLTDAGSYFEGYGFAQGLVYTRFNSFQRNRVLSHARLPKRVREAFFRGFGWGYRQRFDPLPQHLPEGLGLMDLIPEDSHEAFVDGFLGRVLPREAQILGRASG